MKILYIDCFSGISGDMCLAALLDLGVPLSVFETVISQLEIPVEITGTSVYRRSIRATRVIVSSPASQPPERSYRALLEIVEQSSLPESIATKVASSLLRLGKAEAAVHGTDLNAVHFHELGGLDTLVDLAGTFAGISYLGVEQVYASALPLGRGSVTTAHGLLPLPAPATLHLLAGVPTYGVPIEAELITPTGAVLAAALTAGFGPPPAACWEKTGYGAGTRDLPHANVLRFWLGKSLASQEVHDETDLTFDEDQVLILETQIDDTNPELLPYLREQLKKGGAIDVTFTPTLMKKGRPGNIITAISPPEQLLTLANILFRESTALGMRWHHAGRVKLFRSSIDVETPFGKIPVKLGFAMRPDGSREYCNLAPEYEACARIAQETGRSIKEVCQAALQAAGSIHLPQA